MSLKKLYIFDCTSSCSFIGNIKLFVHSLLGYEILIFCKGKNNSKFSKYKSFSYDNTENCNLSHLYSNKNYWTEYLFECLHVQDYLDSIFNKKQIVNPEEIKLRILVKDVFQKNLVDFDELLHVSYLNKDKYNKIKIQYKWNLIKYQVIKTINLSSNIKACYSIPLVCRINFYHVRILFRKIISYGKKVTTTSENKKINAKVVFFPHKGINFGHMFEKDHYYNPDKNSPLNKQRILHIEYKLNNKESSDISQSYQENNLNYYILSRPGIIDAFSFFIKNVKVLFKIYYFFSKKSKKILTLDVFASTYVLFLSEFLSYFYVNKIGSQVDCQYAIVGYDYLLPKEIILALHRLGIVTISAQERLIVPYVDICNVCIDNYMVWNYDVESKITSSAGESYVGRYFVVGPPRSDKIKHNPVKKKIFVVYVNSVKVDSALNDYAYQNNWGTIKGLLEDIIILANMFQECDFRVRFKHKNIFLVPFFRQILSELSKSKNITVIDDYSKFDVSYDILSDAYAVLGHHTSIADEALSVGIPALFHDFGPHTKSIYKPNYDYDGLDIFSHSSKDFQDKFINYFVKGHYPVEVFKFIEGIYSGICDGNVRSRISDTLSRIIN